MNIDEAIKHCEEVAETKCDACGEEHMQLAEWLNELKAFKEKEAKYAWHDLRKDPNDLPNDGERVLFYPDEFLFQHLPYYWTGKYSDKTFCSDDYDGWTMLNRYGVYEVSAWKYIEPFEEAE